MIDALLSDRPDDRRELFEEAAGVGLYRDRRRPTERRLEETTGDLQRLDDLINEVSSQVRSLARQRKRAERPAEIMTRRFTVELSLAAREMEARGEGRARRGRGRGGGGRGSWRGRRRDSQSCAASCRPPKRRRSSPRAPVTRHM